MQVRFWCLNLLFSLGSILAAEEALPALPLHIYKTVGTVALKAHVFEPTTAAQGLRAAIVVFHGGGWNSGEGSWVYPTAQRFAKLGMVAVAIDYRLSDEKTVTPLEAMEDARDALRWVRSQAAAMRLDPKRIAAYGISAGGHLAASAALVPGPDGKLDSLARPDALVLYSPAVAISQSGWVRRLLLNRALPEAISPDQFVRGGAPPTLITQGQEDSVTSSSGAVLFMRRMKAAGNVCELHRYAGAGHLLTRNLDEQEWAFDPDPIVRNAAHRAEEAFLAAQGFLPYQPPVPEHPEAVVRAFTEAFNGRDLDAMAKHTAENVVGFHAGTELPQVELRGRAALRSAQEAALKERPTLRRDLHMLTTNGTLVFARERSTWKAPAGEAQRQNAMVMFEVVEGAIRRMWRFPPQH